MSNGTCTVLTKDQGDAYWIVGDHVSFKLTSNQTAGKYVFAETTVLPGGGPPPHLHGAEDEIFYVLEGEFAIIFGDTTSRHRAGSAVYLPRGIVHTFENVSDKPSRLLVGALPAGFDQFVPAGGCPCTDRTKPQPPDMNRLMAAIQKFGLQLRPDHQAPNPAPAQPADPELWVLGSHVKIKLNSGQTNNFFSVVEVTCQPGAVVPPHRHREMDEIFYILDGVYEFTLDGKKITALPGSFIHVPRGVRHGFTNPGKTPAKLLDYHTPGGFERFFEECGTPCNDAALSPAPVADADIQRFLGMMDRHGMEM